MFTMEELATATGTQAEELNPARVALWKRQADALIRLIRPELPNNRNDWPEAAKVVALRMVARTLEEETRPYGATEVSHSADGFTQSLTFQQAGNGVYMTRADKRLLKGPGRAFTIVLGGNIIVGEDS